MKYILLDVERITAETLNHKAKFSKKRKKRDNRPNIATGCTLNVFHLITASLFKSSNKFHCIILELCMWENKIRWQDGGPQYLCDNIFFNHDNWWVGHKNGGRMCLKIRLQEWPNSCKIMFKFEDAYNLNEVNKTECQYWIVDNVAVRYGTHKVYSRVIPQFF